MAEQVDIPPPPTDQGQPPQPDQQPAPPQRKMYDLLVKGQLYSKSFDDFQKQYSSPDSINKLYDGLKGAQLYSKTRQDFYGQYFPTAQQSGAPSPATPNTPPTPATPPQPEHQISHTPVQDLRHLNDLAKQPIRSTTTTLDPLSGSSSTEDNPEDVARNKGYQDQYQKGITDLATTWGTDPKATKQAIEDFPDEPDENKLKGFAGLAKDNPVYYNRLKSANDIRTAIVQSGQDGVNDANAFNHLQTSNNYEQLQQNIAMQQEIMTKHGLGQAYFEKLKEAQAPLVNTLDPGLNVQYWNSNDKNLGLSLFQYAGLETEKMFSPGKYQQDIAILRQNRGLDDPAGAGPVPQGKKGYAYDRGVENVLYGLENQGRQNDAQYISQRKAELGTQPTDLQNQYQQYIHGTNDPLLQKHFVDEYTANPVIQEARKLDEGADALDYSRSEDQRRFPLNFNDQASREVRDAMSHLNGVQGAPNTGSAVVRGLVYGAGQQSDNTVRFIKNTFINLLGSDQWKAENAASNIGHQSLTDLANYEGSAFSTQQAPMVIDPKLQDGVQKVFEDGTLSYDQKVQKATELVVNNPGQIKANPAAGQQNLTGKAMAYTAANTLGQILGIADQSALMGGLVGDASKAQQMASALVPMYATTQNQLYEQGLVRGDEKPLLQSHLDAAIISLASLINPDIKVVKGMIGADTGLGRIIAGMDESTWNKVLTTNRPLVDRMIAGTKATARQLGLANLQYGLIVPGAEYVVHKNVLNEDPNLGDAIKDGLLQTNLSMALPALLHGVFGGINATSVNPMQKYALVEAGLHPKENIELIDQMIQKGQITPDRATQLKEIINHAGHVLENTDGVKSDGSMMDEQDVANTTYQLLRKKVLEGKLRNAPDPQKPAIEDALHTVNQTISDLHTAEPDKQKTDLNQLLTENLGRIREQIPTMESSVKDAVKRNEPEQVFQEIYDQASQTKTVEGKEVSTRAAAEETFGKELVQKAFDLHNQKTKNNGQETANDAQAGNQGQVTGKPQEDAAAPATTGAAEPAASSFKPTSDKIIPNENYETWQMGKMAGETENDGVKKEVARTVDERDIRPGGDGETFDEFLKRLIPEFNHTLDTEPHNTTITTHSSDLKAMKVYDELGRPDIKRILKGGDLEKEFSKRFNDSETHNGDIETFKGKNGDIHVIRHGETEDNAANKLRSGNTNLTEKGIEEAKLAGQQLNEKTGGDVPKIISSGLPRAIHTSNLVADQLKPTDNAVSEHSTGTLGAHPGGNESPGGTGESQGVGPGQQGEAPPGEAGGKGEGQEPPVSAGGGPVAAGEEGEPRNIEIHHEALNEQARKLGLPEIPRGTYLSKQEYVARGRIMIIGGVDPEKVAAKFQRDGLVNANVISVARAHTEALAKAMYDAEDKGGKGNEEYKAAQAKYQDWTENVMKPMGHAAGETMYTLQEKPNTNFASASNVKDSFGESKGQPLTKSENQKAQAISEEVKASDQRLADLQQKFDDLHQAHEELKKNTASFTEKAKKAADVVRKLKNKPFTFKDENGNDVPIQKMGIGWNDIVEAGAKAIEKTGEIADGIAAVLDHVKDADWYRNLSAGDKNRFEQQLTAHFGGDNLKASFADKTDNKFTTEEAAAVWNHAKGLIGKGTTDFHDVIHQTAMDTGLSPEQVRRAIAQPKGGKQISDAMYAEMNHRRNIIQSAEAWVRSADESTVKKFWTNVFKGPAAVVTALHGTVAPITHVGADLFRATNWSSYFKFMLKSYDFAFRAMTEAGKARYEKAMGDMQKDPLYETAIRAKLKINPNDHATDDYSNYQSIWSKLSKMGERGFNAMKPYRLEQFKKLYNGLSDQAKGDLKSVESVAHMVNLQTGTTSAETSKILGVPSDVVLFAPKLVASQYQRIFSEPAKAIWTFTHPGKSTEAQKLQAKTVALHAGEMVGVYLLSLVANQGLLTAAGSKQNINFLNPLDPDWMKFKVGGKEVDASGGMNSSLRFVGSLMEEGLRANGWVKTEEKGKPGDTEGRKVLQQLKNKLSPLGGDLTELWSGTDYGGNSLPWSSVKPSAGKEKLTYKDYFFSKAPIFISEGYKAFEESAKEKGVPQPMIDRYIQGVVTGIVAGTTGAKVANDTGKPAKPGRTHR